MVNVLFVCLGNICRSPTAQGVFEHLVRERWWRDRVFADSAGTIDFHAGSPPDPRAQAAARAYGVDISGQRARQVRLDDFERFQYILAMDAENLRDLRQLCPPHRHERLRLFCEYAPGLKVRAVPDPYYGGKEGFDRVIRIVEAASRGLIEAIEAEHFAGRAEGRSQRG